jgi:hypothetical protein
MPLLAATLRRWCGANLSVPVRDYRAGSESGSTDQKCRSRTVLSMLGSRDYGAGSEPLRAHDFAGYRVAVRVSRTAITEWVLPARRAIRAPPERRVEPFSGPLSVLRQHNRASPGSPSACVRVGDRLGCLADIHRRTYNFGIDYLALAVMTPWRLQSGSEAPHQVPT